MKDLAAAICAISPLSEEYLRLMLDAYKETWVPRDHVLLREYAVSSHIYYIQQGMARIYYRKAGKDVTEWIAPEGSFFLSITSFFLRTPGKLIIHTIEPAQVFSIHHDALHSLAAAHHEIETHYRKMLASSLILSQARMESIQFETAEQRYRKLIEKNPDFLLRVPLTYIASFLGITLETLSRIRASIC